MNIGDKVRLVHGREEGVIAAFLPGNVVEIEIEDGFRIPVLRNEIVTISPVEAQRMQKAPAFVAQDELVIPSRKAAFAEKGIFAAFNAVNDRTIILYLINNTDWRLPFTAGSQSGDVYKGLAAGMLEPRTQQRVTELEMKDFEAWPTFIFDLLRFREGTSDRKQPFEKRLKCRAQSFYKSKMKAPVLNKESFVYQLDSEESAKPKEVVSEAGIANELRESLMGGKSAEPAHVVEKPANVLDLHIEKLAPEFKGSNEQILSKQVQAFEDGLERAIANGMEEITFIHGSGNGVLKNEIHRRLSKNQHVQYFKDAQKEKFGFGATLVKIK